MAVVVDHVPARHGLKLPNQRLAKMTTIDDYELTTIRIVVGFLTLFAALSLTVFSGHVRVLRDVGEGSWMTALTAFALMILALCS